MMMFLRYFIVTTSAVFLPLFFCFLIVQSQNRGAYYTRVNTVITVYNDGSALNND